MKKYLRLLGHVVVVAVFLLAIYLLYNKLRSYSLVEIRSSINHISNWRIFFSILIMIVNYLILVGYDWLALKAIHMKLPIQRVALVSFVGQAVSYNFGALLGGTSVRFRFYSAWNFSISKIVRLVLMLAVTFWVGALGLCGLIFILFPPDVPGAIAAHIPLQDIRILGGFLLALALAYLALCVCVRKPVHIFGKEIVFPSPGIAVAQCVVAGVDIIAAAACMYVLLPPDSGISFLDFLPGYLLAQVAVVITHVPGGVGIFELVILELSHVSQEQSVFAAVLLFRLIYYILPLIAAAVLLSVYEVRQRKDMLRDAGRWLAVLSHTISAYLAFVAGVILLVSSVLPSPPRFFWELYNSLPYVALVVGRVVCAMSGAGLLFASYGLERRQSRAFRLVVGLLCAGIGGALLKDFSWVTALLVSFILLAVCLARRRFYRTSMLYTQKFSLPWLGVSFGVLLVAGVFCWVLYHPLGPRWRGVDFAGSSSATSVLLAACGICVMLFVGWIWRFWQQQKNGVKPK